MSPAQKLVDGCLDLSANAEYLSYALLGSSVDIVEVDTGVSVPLITLK